MTAAKSKPKFQVVDDVFVAQTTEGELKIPLRLKTKLVRQINVIDDDLERVFAILDGIGDAKTADALDELDIFATADLVKEFFDAFSKKAQATPGESSGSSKS